jgi:hypothetical protein
MPEPWDQQEGEPRSAYVRFLLYRSLGPGRSIDEAYRLLLQQRARGAKSSKTRAPGNWYQESSKWNWNDRASEWDIAALLAVGDDSIASLVTYVRDAVRRAHGSLSKLEPKTWSDVLESLDAFGHALPPEVVAAALSRARGRGS